MPRTSSIPLPAKGICAALRGAELAVETAHSALQSPGPVSAGAGRLCGPSPEAEFLGKWTLERMIGWAMFSPRLFDRAVERIERRGWSDTLIGVTGAFIPPRAVLNPRFLAGLVW